MKVRKAIIPCAGMGTRFLPWTKAVPKEMLPVVDKPVVQYVVEEAVASGIEQIIIVTSWHKRAIEDYFDHQADLEEHLLKQGKTKALRQVKRISEMADFVYVRQKGPYGNATPVLSARNVIGDEPFALLWGDQFVWAQPPRLRQVLDVFEKEDVVGVVAGMRVPPEVLVTKGVCRIAPYKNQEKVHQLLEIIEKPKPEEAPSDMAAYGTYVFKPDIFPILEQLKPAKDGEIWLVDAISKLCQEQMVLVSEIANGQFYDGGNKLAYHKAVVDFMLRDPEIGAKMLEYLKEKVK
ncbi:UTP--glucose-1-phosphate uridylyltransferase [Candidatus Beckwithbacteria bacterium RBG_13_42_9]|uniref:UTP--glucose-1-phosphate uridylyltransferase n=1 Tax=Candidatus Beckwithbacteria bacterium RBG_13_42_9 TaxID=1797457 RepID=A0A1F5E6J7_9BACT|nr:MAG: UTP--glucose-1-phosphate uridylyltransferase [Candidatus Beckwithbacteria bacterium RBG_13_42_9]